ncbi:MAG: GNAT family N-acetyltransferase [Deltaproteobacteria bacterium]|nr:GNAT family N-acetyltransferase [Deltaproteobacteria bacterium]
MKLRLVDLDGFLDCARAWKELLAACENPSPFMSQAWIASWWQCFSGPEMDFMCLLAERDGRLLAGLPLSVRRIPGPGRALRLAELAGSAPVPTRGMGLADRADMLCRADAPGAGRELARALGSLVGERFDLALLVGVPGGSALARIPGARAGIRSLSPYLPLDGGWDACLARRGRGFTRTLRRRRRALRASGRVEHVRLDAPDGVAADIERIFALSRRCRAARRGSDLFRHPALARFFARTLPAMAADGLCACHVLLLDGQALAYEICFELGGRVLSYTGAFDERFARFSPGTLLTAEIIAEACARGRREYDFLRGEEDYKLRWTAARRCELEVALSAGAVAGLGAAALMAGCALRASPRLTALDGRVSGLWNRLRWRSGP